MCKLSLNEPQKRRKELTFTTKISSKKWRSWGFVSLLPRELGVGVHPFTSAAGSLGSKHKGSRKPCEKMSTNRLVIRGPALSVQWSGSFVAVVIVEKLARFFSYDMFFEKFSAAFRDLAFDRHFPMRKCQGLFFQVNELERLRQRHFNRRGECGLSSTGGFSRQC
ncbi:hypothetical protein NCAS_0I01550 [Naumovozyma castellii]|uniref:Uncharacterized protein n=1 Tax=Naumovozyma castellii TaxID=27288 RepID=G0VJY9_NAUCA|nr:hypothetical protein NCAS_0I01550 [Naumovozyma castellii CBS 4309]CCC71823.1 hypothetical protein NCAS_0I01550 [Naumovozyma castellii CBS 4309]